MVFRMVAQMRLVRMMWFLVLAVMLAVSTAFAITG
jgi:hypothetical protein